MCIRDRAQALGILALEATTDVSVIAAKFLSTLHTLADFVILKLPTTFCCRQSMNCTSCYLREASISATTKMPNDKRMNQPYGTEDKMSPAATKWQNWRLSISLMQTISWHVLIVLEKIRYHAIYFDKCSSCCICCTHKKRCHTTQYGMYLSVSLYKIEGYKYCTIKVKRSFTIHNKKHMVTCILWTYTITITYSYYTLCHVKK